MEHEKWCVFCFITLGSLCLSCCNFNYRWMAFDHLIWFLVHPCPLVQKLFTQACYGVSRSFPSGPYNLFFHGRLGPMESCKILIQWYPWYDSVSQGLSNYCVTGMLFILFLEFLTRLLILNRIEMDMVASRRAELQNCEWTRPVLENSIVLNVGCN